MIIHNADDGGGADDVDGDDFDAGDDDDDYDGEDGDGHLKLLLQSISRGQQLWCKLAISPLWPTDRKY